MDVNELRTILMVLSFLAFLGIIAWAYSPKSKRRFDEAANLPFADDDLARKASVQADKEHSNG